MNELMFQNLKSGERRFRLDKFMDIARTVMARRGREPGVAECARLSALHGAGAG